MMFARAEMKWSRKPKLILAGALLAACAFAGGAWAASDQTTPAASRQAFLSDVAKRLGTTPQKLTAALQAAYFDQLNAAVKAGRLTRAEANTIERAVRQHGFGPFGPLFLPPLPLVPGKAPRGFAPRSLPPGFPPRSLPRGFSPRSLPAPPNLRLARPPNPPIPLPQPRAKG